MSQTTMPCACCGCILTYEEDTAVRDCPACGTRNAPPRLNGDTLLILQRAIEQRVACDFHNAELSYQQVLLYRPDAHEALWGRLLCHYGVEYVEDPATHRRMPTVHTVRSKPLQAEPDFARACKLAPDAIRAQYEQDAAYIDGAQAEIRQRAKSCQPYDVFLCHKTTKSGSKEKTEDFHRATQLYHFLKDQGVKVFFAPECLQDAAGANYEAGIYHALHTAKIMLLICSEPEYLTSAWVRSEWSRFMTMMEEEPEKQIIPLLYDHFDPSELPAQFLFGSIQGLDMGDINAPQRLTKAVLEAVGRPGQQPAPQPDAAPAAPQAEKEAAKEGQCSVTMSFPGLRPHWREVPQWCVVSADGKKVLADVSWGSTVTVPIDAERTQVLCVVGKPEPEKMEKAKAKLRRWRIVLIVAVVMTVLSIVLLANANHTMTGVFGGMTLVSAIIAVIAAVRVKANHAWAKLTTRTPSGHLLRNAEAMPATVVSAGGHYDLSWSDAGKGDRLRADER